MEKNFFLDINMKILRACAWSIVGLVFFLGYFLTQFRGIRDPQVMDLAQVGQSLYVGKGFTTKIIRPLSFAVSPRINNHPDLMNPPLMPMLISLAFSIGGVDDTMVCFTSGAFFLFAGALLYYFTLKILDRACANISLLLYFSNSLLLRYAISGSEIPLLIFLFLALFLMVYMFFEKNTYLLACGIGVVLGLLFLTRYWTFILLAPLGVLIYKKAKTENISKLLVGLFAFLGLVLPWWVRNMYLTANPLFTLSSLDLRAFFTGISSADWARSLLVFTPATISFVDIFHRFVANLNWAYFNALMLTRNFVIAFFLMGFFCRFKKSHIFFHEFKYWLFLLMAIHFCYSGFSRHIAEQMIIYTPFIIMIGVGFLFEMWHRLDIQRVVFRKMVVPVFLIFNTVPLFFAFALPQRPHETVRKNLFYLQSISKNDEVVVSDAPWRVAWFANRAAIWTPLWGDDFLRLVERMGEEERKKIKFAYLTPALLRLSGKTDNPWRRVYQEGKIPEGFLFTKGVKLPQGELLLVTADQASQLEKRSKAYLLKPGQSDEARQ